MRKIAFQTLAFTALASGLLSAQGFGPGRGGPPQGQFQNQQMDPQQMAEWRVNRLAALLDLTEAQKTQARSIFEKMLKDTQALQPNVLKAREALQAAVKDPKKTDQLAQLSGQLGAVTTGIRTIHALAHSQFYNNVLLPAQRTKLDNLGGQGMGMGRGRGGMGMNCPFGARP